MRRYIRIFGSYGILEDISPRRKDELLDHLLASLDISPGQLDVAWSTENAPILKGDLEVRVYTEEGDPHDLMLKIQSVFGLVFPKLHFHIEVERVYLKISPR